MKKITGRLVIVLLMIIIAHRLGFAFSPASHIYIGKNTFEVWQDFDPVFYQALTCTTCSQTSQILIKKFYYVGLTLPDMFDNQFELREVITSIYNNGNSNLKYPVHIKTTTYEGVQNTMAFADRSSEPNQDINALRNMVEYARNQGWSPYQKALIYGTYMHAIQDQFAHYILQPSLFGYSKAYDISQGTILGHPENYYELFTQTFIPPDDWDFISTIYKGMTYANGWLPDYFSSSYDILSVYDISNLDPVYKSFQDFDESQGYQYQPVAGFVEAANSPNGLNLAPESEISYSQLKAYIYAWTFALFGIYGYRPGYENQDRGGIFRHIEWDAEDIANQQEDMISPFLTSGNWLLDFLLRIFGSLYNAGATVIHFFGGPDLSINALMNFYISLSTTVPLEVP